MSKQHQDVPNGIAIIVNDEGILQKVIRDSYHLCSSNSNETISFIDCVGSDSLSKAYQFLARIKTNDMAYNWELHIKNDGEISLFRFSGIRIDGKNVLIGTDNRDDSEQFLNGLMEMNNESINRLRAFMKEQQGKPDEPKEDERALYNKMSGLNNELANMQRELTKKTAELERANERKNQIMGMAAHDLRNPLNVIVNYADFLLDDHLQGEANFTEDQFQMIKQMKESSEYMVHIIEDMLDMSALESGDITLEKESCDLVDFIENIVSLSRSSAQKKDIAITTHLPDSSVSKDIDCHKFRQVFDNLLSNAIKYSDPGTEVEVGINPVDETGDVTVYVKDHGQGIPEEEIDKLFQPFSDISVEATAGEKSTGLGLAIVEHIVEAHGGTIEVESEVGVGSTFYINIS
ncbi:sensor histidine kinase [Fodinibius sp. AD559]|uniref:sensor histidine kinase n=1 Tax=Fodinibius sp. AD559 TaxID=3424179 RepID=UPI004046EF4D